MRVPDERDASQRARAPRARRLARGHAAAVVGDEHGARRRRAPRARRSAGRTPARRRRRGRGARAGGRRRARASSPASAPSRPRSITSTPALGEQRRAALRPAASAPERAHQRDVDRRRARRASPPARRRPARGCASIASTTGTGASGREPLGAAVEVAVQQRVADDDERSCALRRRDGRRPAPASNARADQVDRDQVDLLDGRGVRASRRTARRRSARPAGCRRGPVSAQVVQPALVGRVDRGEHVAASARRSRARPARRPARPCPRTWRANSCSIP